MKHNIFFYSAIVLLAISLNIPSFEHTVFAQEVAYREDFEDGQAQDWELEPGWQVIQDDGKYVLAGQGHTWAGSTKFYDDYRLSLRLKVLQGSIHLVYRLNDTGRYFIGFHQNGTYLSKQYWPDTFFENLAGSNTSHDLNAWHQIEISGKGGTLELLVDGTAEWTYTDSQPLLEGKFAFETLDDSQAYVDDIEVELDVTSAYIGSEDTSSLIWTRTGGPLGGLGYDIRMMPDNPDVMLVSDAWAGVFRSADGGANWLPSNDGITVRTGGTADAIPIFCLTIDPADPNIVWVGTQNTRGIFKSTDGGLTWTRKDQGIKELDGITFRGFAVDPANSNVVYAAAELSSWVWNNGQPRNGREFDMTGGVVYKTTDGGENWIEVWRGDNLARYIWIDPRDTNVLYLSTGIFDREAANSDPQAGRPGGEGVLISTDGGVTWTNTNNGLNNLYVGSLFMHPADPDTLLAGTGNNQYFDQAGVYLSEDGGANWKQVLRDDIIEAVEFASSNPSIAYAGSSNAIYRSEDGGHTWKRVSGGGEDGWGAPGVRAGFPIDFQVDPRDPDRIFANEYGGGNFVSEDGGWTWSNASRGYTGAQVRAIAVDPNEPGRVIAAARSGIFISRDGGSNWAGLSNPPVVTMEWNAVAIDPADPNHVVAETNWGNFLIDSRDGGANWTRAFNFGEQRVGWRVVVFAPSDPSIVYAGSTGYYSAGSFDPSQPGQGIYVSQNEGNSWLPANNELSQDASVYGLAVDPQNPQIVYAATSNHGLLKTINGGQEWVALGDGLPQDMAMSVAIHPIDSNVIYAGFERQSLFMSVNGGQTWEATGRGMNPEANIASIIFDRTDPQVMYVADLSNGVYRSSNGGQTWTAINTGLLMRSVNALAISSDGLHLYAATEGGGVYRLDLNGQPPVSVPRPEAASPIQTESQPAPAPAETQPVSTPKPAGNVPCGSVFLPLFLFGSLVWISRRKSIQ